MYRRAPFIWTAKQTIDIGAFFGAFLGVGPLRREEGTNRWFLFRRVFHLASFPDEARVIVTVDGRYQLFINGKRVGRGPARCDPMHQRTDTYDLRTHLRAGENVIAMLIHVYGVDTAWYQRVEGMWQPVFGDGALYCDGRIRCGDTTVDLVSDTQWRCLECPAWEPATPRVNWGLGFIEVHDARAMPDGWTTGGFDDSGWDPVQLLSAGGGPPDAFFGGMKVEPFPVLMPREIGFLDESPLAPSRILAWYGVSPRPDLPIDRRLYEEPLGALPAELVDDPQALLSPDARATRVYTAPGCDVSFVLDFGRIHSGFLFIDVEASGGEVIEVAVAEGIPGDWGLPPPAEPRIDRERAHGAQIFRYAARPGVQRFERFEWTAVRYAQVTVRNAPNGVGIRHVGSTFTRYLAAERGAFACSDEMLNRLWDVGRYTLQLCMHDGWEDCPSREQRQWLGDATVEFLVGQAAFGPDVNALNRQFLRHCAESQRSDGLTQMFAPGDHRTNGLLIPDWTLQWIMNAERHYLYTAELEVIEAIFPAIERALQWFAQHLDANGLVADLPYWHFHDWAAVGRHGEAATLNAELAGALRAAARLATVLESARTTRRLEAQAARIATALNDRHWDAMRGVYVDCVDPVTSAQGRRVSQHANAALILWDIAPRERWASMVECITDPARLVFTPAPPIVPIGEPFDAETDVVLANTFYSHFVYQALAKAGRFDRALALIRERYGKMLARGATTLWESFDPTGSLCHGFSTTPVYQLSTQVLGVYPVEPGFTRFRLAPQPVDLDHANGVFPTVHGDIHIAWRRESDDIVVDVTIPDGTLAEVAAPEGYARVGPALELAVGSHRVRFVPL
jgi:alpha-L-rhamnosidase